MKNVWRLVVCNPDRDQNQALAWIRKNDRISVGWGRIGDLQKQHYRSAQKIGEAIRKQNPDARNSHLGGPSLWNLLRMRKGDLVILSAHGRRASVVAIDGKYKYAGGPPHQASYRHQRKVHPTNTWNPEDLWKRAGGRAAGEGVRWTLIRCQNQV
jgi:hypothetical protein